MNKFGGKIIERNDIKFIHHLQDTTTIRLQHALQWSPNVCPKIYIVQSASFILMTQLLLEKVDCVVYSVRYLNKCLQFIFLSFSYAWFPYNRERSWRLPASIAGILKIYMETQIGSCLRQSQTACDCLGSLEKSWTCSTFVAPPGSSQLCGNTNFSCRRQSQTACATPFVKN